jgi:hypothetical protein
MALANLHQPTLTQKHGGFPKWRWRKWQTCSASPFKIVEGKMAEQNSTPSEDLVKFSRRELMATT